MVMKKKRQNRNWGLCVCYYNFHMSCSDRSAAAQTKRMSKWYVKLFRMVLNATILFPRILYGNKVGWMSRIKIGWKVYYLKFRTDFIEGLLLKYSVQQKILGHRSYGNCKGTERMTSQQQPPPPKKKKGGGGCCCEHGWKFWGLWERELLLRQCKWCIYHLQPTENYHSKSHSHGTKNMEVILDQKASDVELVQVKLISW